MMILMASDLAKHFTKWWWVLSAQVIGLISLPDSHDRDKGLHPAGVDGYFGGEWKVSLVLSNLTDYIAFHYFSVIIYQLAFISLT